MLWLLLLVLVPVLLLGLACLSMVPLWVQVRTSGIPIAFTHLIAMRLRRLSPAYILDNMISLHKSGLEVPVTELEAHVMSGGILHPVVDAVISGHKAGLDVDFKRVAAIDLAGRNVVDAVNACVNPKVLECPAKQNERLQGVAQDGIRLGAKVRITVRTNLSRLVGGAGEATVVARVGQGIVAAIGSATSHKEILERPEIISAYILARGLDVGTAYEIVSVDVADVDVLDNVGARLAEAQADADQQVAQARAESRRVQATARQREMRARIIGMTSEVKRSQALVPQGMAAAYRGGRIWRSPRPVQSYGGRLLWDATQG